MMSHNQTHRYSLPQLQQDQQKVQKTQTAEGSKHINDEALANKHKVVFSKTIINQIKKKDS